MADAEIPAAAPPPQASAAPPGDGEGAEAPMNQANSRRPSQATSRRPSGTGSATSAGVPAAGDRRASGDQQSALPPLPPDPVSSSTPRLSLDGIAAGEGSAPAPAGGGAAQPASGGVTDLTPRSATGRPMPFILNPTVRDPRDPTGPISAFPSGRALPRLTNKIKKPVIEHFDSDPSPFSGLCTMPPMIGFGGRIAGLRLCERAGRPCRKPPPRWPLVLPPPPRGDGTFPIARGEQTS